MIDRLSTGYLQVTVLQRRVTDHQQAIFKSHFPPKEGWQTTNRLSTSHTFLQRRGDRLSTGYLQVTLSSKGGVKDYQQAIYKSHFPPKEGWQTINRLSTSHTFLQRMGDRLSTGSLQVTLSSKNEKHPCRRNKKCEVGTLAIKKARVGRVTLNTHIFSK